MRTAAEVDLALLGEETYHRKKRKKPERIDYADVMVPVLVSLVKKMS